MQWIELRALPGVDVSEISYIRYNDIERISLVEHSQNEIVIYISALGGKYLYTTVETLKEAQEIAKGIMQDLDSSLPGGMTIERLVDEGALLLDDSKRPVVPPGIGGT